MIGGLFKPAGVVSIAAAGMLMGSVSAHAADLGGNCCADLEERVAELEATTARKGNRKVSLEVSGHVNEAILVWDDGYDTEAYIGTNNYSRTRFRFKGSAQINADWSAGFLIEVGLRRTGDSGGWDQDGLAKKGLDIRHQALYVKSRSLGTLWLGHTATATDGIADICLGCTITSSHEANLGWGGFVARVPGGAILPSDLTWKEMGAGNNIASGASRRQLLRYISPTLAGFVLSADWGGATSVEDDLSWSVALRYAGEFGAIRVAGGIGYHEEDIQDGFLHGWGGSLSLQHTPTGLFVAGSYGEQTDDGTTRAGLGAPVGTRIQDTEDGWSVAAGIGQKWMALGKTTLWGRYGEYGGRTLGFDTDAVVGNDTWAGDGDTVVWSLGFNQQIDAAAMELYVTYWNVSGDYSSDDGVAAVTVDPKDFQAVMMGARIKF